MIEIAPRSSKIASDSKNIRICGEKFPPKSIKHANEKAISVAVGIAQPTAKDVPPLKNRYANAGTTIPPTAAINGNATNRLSFKNPNKNSCRISIVTSKKNNAINPSLINGSNCFLMPKSPIEKEIYCVHMALYSVTKPILHTTIAMHAEIIINTPGTVSFFTKARHQSLSTILLTYMSKLFNHYQPDET